MNQWKAKKTLAMYEEDMLRSGLRRVLGKWSLTALGVGSVIGAGIFVMTGLAAKEFAGPALAPLVGGESHKNLTSHQSI